MAHSIKVFEPTSNVYNEFETPWTPAVAFSLPVWGVLHLFLWGIVPFVGWLTLLSILIPSFFLLYMTRTHEMWTLDRDERALWSRYNKLDPEVRAKIALDIPTVKKIGSDLTQWQRMVGAFDLLEAEQKRRKSEEARLDPTAVVVLESINQATEEEKQYRHEIRKVLGDFEKAETPEERLTLAEKIRARVQHR